MWSTDLQTWRARSAYSPNPYNGDMFFNDSIPEPPLWSNGGRQRLPGKSQWAPGVAKIGGAWVSYTAWETTPGRRCISAARSLSPSGPFRDDAAQPLVCDADPDGSIDAEPFVDQDGQAYLLWKSEGIPGMARSRLWSRPLKSDGLSFKSGSSPSLLLDNPSGWEGQVLENPSMAFYGGSYWLTYSANEWASANYRIGQAPLRQPGGSVPAVERQPLIGNTATDLGAGGQSLFTDTTGRLRVAYHAWNAPYSSYPTDPNCDGPGLCISRASGSSTSMASPRGPGSSPSTPSGFLTQSPPAPAR